MSDSAADLCDRSLSPLDQMSDRELLIAILNRLDAVEERIELAAQMLDVRIDSMLANGQPNDSTTAALAAKQPDDTGKPDDPGSQGGGQMGDLLALTDSIMDLLNWWAEDTYGITEGPLNIGRGWEGLTICGHAAVEPKLALDWNVWAEGEGKGSVGAWAGTGAFAGVMVKIKKNLKAGVEVGGGLEIEGCRNFQTARASRSAPTRNNDPRFGGLGSAAASLAVEDEALMNAIESLQGVLGMDGQTLATSLTRTQTLLNSTQSFEQIREIGAAVTLPSGFSGIVDDPLGAAAGVLPDIADRVFDFTCSGRFNTGRPRLNSILDDGCAIITDQNNTPDVLGLLGLTDC